MPMNNHIHLEARGERIESALGSRIFGLGRGTHRWLYHLVLLLDGHLAIGNRPEGDLSGPALVTFPPTEGLTVTFQAGAHGYLIGAGPEILGEAIGDNAESASLRTFTLQRSAHPIQSLRAVRETTTVFHGFVDEIQRDGNISRMMLSAYMRLAIMRAWRLTGVNETYSTGQPDAGALLQRFRQSVEFNFRRHRTIADYAAELKITPDRLHAICTRMLSRSPIELVHERVAQEARQHLERSSRPIQEISDSLGFREPSNFSHFFKRMTGVSPVRYRQVARDATEATDLQLASSYHDWP
ncbi:MAG: AraC family transcriptional regulator [Rhizobium sp.]|nr:AraC family transcriptional regulator [Rhizobium sp.]